MIHRFVSNDILAKRRWILTLKVKGVSYDGVVWDKETSVEYSCGDVSECIPATAIISDYYTEINSLSVVNALENPAFSNLCFYMMSFSTRAAIFEWLSWASPSSVEQVIAERKRIWG
jgi:hypothetical protein